MSNLENIALRLAAHIHSNPINGSQIVALILRRLTVQRVEAILNYALKGLSSNDLESLSQAIDGNETEIRALRFEIRHRAKEVNTTPARKPQLPNFSVPVLHGDRLSD